MTPSGRTITVLGGAGLMGSGIIRDLISDLAICRISEVRVCDLAAARIIALVEASADKRLKAWPLNVNQPGDISAALRGADLCINAVPTLAGFQMTIFETCLAQRCDYIDLGGLGTYTVKQLAWRPRFEAAGVTAVIGTGSDPGMSNMLCRAVADGLDEIDKINLYWAAELSGDENPVLVPPYSISTVLAEYSRPSVQFLDGEHIECAPMSGTEIIDLPPPWGQTEFIYSPHSEQLTVPLAAGIKDKGIREFTWKLHLPRREHEAWVGLVKAGFGDFDLPISVNGTALKPIDFLSALMERNIEKSSDRIPAQQSHEIHFAIGEGRLQGKPMRARWEVIVGPDELYENYVDAGTSMNASIAAQLVLQSERKPGVWAPEEIFATEPYFEQVRRRRMRVSSQVTELQLPASLP